MISHRASRRSLLLGGATAWAAAAPEIVKLPRKVRLGIIGFDGHVGEVLRALPVMPDVELAAAADAGSDAAARRAALRNPAVARAAQYEGYAEMLKKEKLDCVAVCNNDGDRAAAVLACLERRLQVIAEKPLATRRADFDRIRKAAGAQGVGMLLPMRYDAPYVAMKKVVDAGEIGEIGQIDAQKSYQLGSRPEWQKNARTYGSTILWIGPHMIDLMTWTSGRALTRASSFQSRVGFPAVRDMQTASATIFRLDNGGTATLRMDYFRPSGAKGHGDDRLRLAGTKGVIEYQERTGVIVSGANGERVVPAAESRGSVFLDFVRAVYGGAKPSLGWEEIVKVNLAALAAHEAAESGKVVAI